MQITFLPMNKTEEAVKEETVLGAAIRLGIDINGICAGNGSCGKCKVLVTKGNDRDFTQAEIEHLTETEQNSGIRLGCQLTVSEDTCVILSGERDQDKEQKNHREQCRATRADRMGVVFDLGTTTVEAALYDLSNCEMLCQASAPNPQAVYGADVISRITYCTQDDKNMLRMKELIQECCNQLITEMLDMVSDEEKQELQGKIIKMIVAGNTTMSHLFLGKTVSGLARTPFQPSFFGVQHMSNRNREFCIALEADILILPNISGNVGSDTLGCMMTVNLKSGKGIQLIVDIGTNGEMVLLNNGKMSCCSTAAGPAFEGSSISQGMKASAGAVKAVKLSDHKLELDVVGNTEPKGICGSGILDAVCVMLELGVIDEGGRILEGKEFSLKEGKVAITQKDVREVQLAKAAIYAGIMTLLELSGVKAEDIDQLYLAGTFGSNVNLDNVIKIGMLPDIAIDKMKLIGNGALSGAAKVLFDTITEKEMEDLAEETEHIELANITDFTKMYISAINFRIKERE